MNDKIIHLGARGILAEEILEKQKSQLLFLAKETKEALYDALVQARKFRDSAEGFEAGSPNHQFYISMAVICERYAKEGQQMVENLVKDQIKFEEAQKIIEECKQMISDYFLNP